MREKSYKSKYYSGMTKKNRRKLATRQNLARSTNRNTGEVNQVAFSRREHKTDIWFKKTYTSSPVSIDGILTWVLFGVIVIFVLAFIVRGANGNLPTFYSFLKMLENAPSVNVQFSDFLFNLGDWGAFNFLRDFFDLLTKLVSFLGWIGACLFNFLSYAFYFLRWLFVGA